MQKSCMFDETQFHAKINQLSVNQQFTNQPLLYHYKAENFLLFNRIKATKSDCPNLTKKSVRE